MISSGCISLRLSLRQDQASLDLPLFHLLFITFYIMLYYSIVYYIIVDYVILYHFKLCIIILYGLFKKKFINDFLRVLAQYVNIFRCLCVRLEH